MDLDKLETAKPAEIAALCYRDPVLFCRFFLRDLFPTPIPWFHRAILAILTRRTDFLDTYGEVDRIMENFLIVGPDRKPIRSIFTRLPSGTIQMLLGKYTLLKVPRGFAKTTVAGNAVPIRDTVYQEVPFTVYVSETAPHAKMQLNNVKRQLATNPRIQAVFGNQQPDRNAAEKWAEEFFETTNKVAMAARGRGGQIRGLNHLGQRPKKIICDDLEDKESVSTDLQRQKTREWAYGDLMPALPEMDPEATITALGTLLHPDALLETWAADPQWTVVSLGALDVRGEPVWPQNLDHHKLEVKKQSYAMAGQLHVYYMEFFNEARAADTQLFRQEFFRWGPHEGELRHAIYCDPAISERAEADEAVITVVGMSERGLIIVREMWAKRGATPREIIDAYFALSKKYKCERHGVEANAYQAALIHLMREEMFRKKRYFEIEAVKHKTKKTERIEGILQPRYASGYIQHEHRLPALEAQLLDWPRGKHDDHPDSLAGAIALLDPYAAAAAGDEDLGQDEYEPLEEVMGGQWRGI